MIRLLIVACLCWAAVAAQQPLILPAPPPPPVGALTRISLAVQATSVAYINEMDHIYATNYAILGNYIRQNGGIGGDYHSFKAYADQLDNGFWQFIYDSLEDLAWNNDQLIAQALTDIEREFQLVINQPLVRFWLRQLRQLPRIGENRLLALLDNYRQQWNAIVASNQQKYQELNRQAQSSCPQEAQRKYEELIKSDQHLEELLTQMKLDMGKAAMDLWQQGLVLANNIYQAEIEALHYFVS